MECCKIDGCNNRLITKGLCAKHYARLRRYGDPHAMRRQTPKPQPDFCNVEGCGRKPYSLGFCEAHYTRNRRHGDPIGGRTPVGSPLKWINEHRNYGGEDCIPWPFASGNGGYGVISHEGHMCSAAKLMCKIAHGAAPTKTHEAAHSCGNGHLGCMNPKHLRWATRSENHADMHIHGTAPIGQKSTSAKLTNKQAIEIRELKGEFTCDQLAEKYGVSRSLISLIWRGKRWMHVN